MDCHPPYPSSLLQPGLKYPTLVTQAECREAKKELQKELSSGVSVGELRKRLTGGSQATAPPPPRPRKEYRQNKIERQGRDFSTLINNFGKGGPVELPPPRDPTKLEKAAEAFLEQDGEEVVSRKMYKFGGDQVLVLATAQGKASKVVVASTIPGSLTLHYGFVANKGGGWEVRGWAARAQSSHSEQATRMSCRGLARRRLLQASQGIPAFRSERASWS